MKNSYSALSIRAQLLIMLTIPFAIIVFLLSLVWFVQAKRIITVNAQETLVAEKNYYLSLLNTFVTERAKILETTARELNGISTILRRCMTWPQTLIKIFMKIYSIYTPDLKTVYISTHPTGSLPQILFPKDGHGIQLRYEITKPHLPMFIWTACGIFR